MAVQLTKAQAAEALGVSTKTVELWVKKGRLTQTLLRKPGSGAPMVVFDSDQVEAAKAKWSVPFAESLKSVAEVPAWLKDASQNIGEANGAEATTATDITTRQQTPAAVMAVFEPLIAAMKESGAGFRDSVETLQKAMDKLLEPRVSADQKDVVTMREAIALGHLRTRLVEAVHAGTLENVGTKGRYRFRRQDLRTL